MIHYLHLFLVMICLLKLGKQRLLKENSCFEAIKIKGLWQICFLIEHFPGDQAIFIVYAIFLEEQFVCAKILHDITILEQKIQKQTLSYYMKIIY